VEPFVSFQIGRKRKLELIKTPDAELLQGFNLGKTHLFSLYAHDDWPMMAGWISPPRMRNLFIHCR
jgi:hypothetical protein